MVIGNRHAFVPPLPRTANRPQLLLGVGKAKLPVACLAGKEPEEASRPGMRGQRVERLVVKGRYHLGERGGSWPRQWVGHGLDRRPPNLLGGWLKLSSEPLPFDGKLFGGPGNVNHSRRLVQSAVANHPGPDSHATTVGLRQLQADWRLGTVGFRPEPLQQLAVLDQFNKHPSTVIAGAGEGQ